VLFLGAVPASAQGGAGTAAAGSLQLEKGAVEFGAIFGSALPVSWLRAHADRHLTMASLDVGRVVSKQKGRGPLAGNFEFLLEITPLLVVQQPAHTFGLTASPLHMRWNFAAGGARLMRVFAEASGGIVYTSQPVPVRATTSFNFIDQAGFGVRIASRARHEWLAGYRFQHISNAGRVAPNPGANFNFIYIGVTFVH
jgi:hypothetical protein